MGLAPWIFIKDSTRHEAMARRHGAVVILFLALALLLPGTGVIPLIDRDEPRFVEATREMMETGDWFVPHFNGGYRFDKPILTYWLMAPWLWVVERTGCFPPEMGARLHSVISAALLGVVIFRIGQRWFSSAAGLLAGAGFVSCFQLVLHGRSAVADMPMVLFVTLAQYALFELLHGNPSRRLFWMLYLSLGLGFLAKGPVAWLVPLLTLLFYRFLFSRKPLPWHNLRLAQGILVMLLVVGAWGIPALIKTRGLFWAKGMGEHVFERGFSTMAGFRHFFLYYLLTALISLFPWVAYGGFVWRQVRRDWGPKNAFLVSWIVATYLFFSFYFTQLPHYVMPAFPAVFLLFGQLATASFETGRWSRLWFRGVLAAGALAGGGVLLFSLTASFSEPLHMLRPVFFAAGLGLLALTLIGLLPWSGSIIGLAVCLFIAAVSLQLLGHGLRRVSVTARLPVYLDALPPETERVSSGFNEPGIVYYSHARWNQDGEEPEQIAARMLQPGPRAVVLLDREWPLEYYFQNMARENLGLQVNLRQKDYVAVNETLPSDSYRVHFLEGVNPARTSWVRVRVLVRPF